MPLAVITLEFDPVLRLGDWAVRWETLAIGGAILVGLVLAGLLAGRTPLPGRAGDTSGGHLRPDDVLFIALGVVPGAILGGRLAYVALHLDYYASHPAAIVDPASGGLALSGAVVLGALSGGLVARLFDAPIGRWYEIGAVPMLAILSLGKAANILGGTGQGLPSGVEWATRYLGPGPWGSLGPAVPAYPAQAVEALAVALLLVVVALTWAVGGLRALDGRGFALALGGWAAVRFAVAGTWRDPIVVGPLRVEQVIDLAIVGLALLILAGLIARARRARRIRPVQPDARGPAQLATRGPAVAGAEPDGVSSVTDTPPPRGLR